MKLLTYFLIVLLSIAGKSEALQWDSLTLEKCNTAKSLGYLNNEEKQVIFYVNLVRINPALFAETYLKNYLDTAPVKKSNYITSLIKDLQNTPSLEVLRPQFDLFEVSKKHATEMGLHGKTGHISANGDTYETRAIEISRRYEKTMENCQYGYNNALSIVIDLLIDEDITDLSHRKSLLNRDLKYIGAAIRKHKIYRFNCVIELGYQLKSN